MRNKIRIKSSSFSSYQLWWQWLVVLVAIALVIGAVGIGWRLQEGRQWDGERRLTWIVSDQQAGSGVELWSFEPGIGLTVIQLPPEVRVHVAYGYGEYLISGLYGLARQEGKIGILTKTLEYELGVPVEGYLIKNTKYQILNIKNKEEFLRNFKNHVRGWWLGEVDSNLSWGDRVWLWWKLQKIRYDQVRVVNFVEGNWARSVIDVDGQSVVWFDHTTVDSRLPVWLADTRVSAEGQLVRIVNTTGIAGLGGQIARIVSGLGAKVIEVRDAGGAVGQCVILGTEELWMTSYTARRLQGVLDCKQEVGMVAGGRADVELRVGFEQAKVWKGKN